MSVPGAMLAGPPVDLVVITRDAVLDVRALEPMIAEMGAQTPRVTAIEETSAAVDLEWLTSRGIRAVVGQAADLARLGGDRRSDVILLDSRCRLPGRWFARLGRAAYSADNVACASALVVEPVSNDAVLAASSPVRDRPRFPRCLIATPGCVYLRRSALDLRPFPKAVGSDVTTMMQEWCAAISACGFINVVADDLVASMSDRLQLAVTAPGPQVGRFQAIDDADDTSPLSGARSVSRLVARPLDVTVDARSLTRIDGGTQRYTMELIAALAGQPSLDLRVVLPPDANDEVRDSLADLRSVVSIDYAEAAAGVAKSDVVHRPQQIFSPSDIALLRLLGRRIVVTHQDLIAYHNPAYHADLDQWQQFRRTTRLAFTVSDRMIFFSEAARDDAAAEGFVTAGRSDVIGIALEGLPTDESRPPAHVTVDANFVLCLGADYAHKNRPFAMKVLAGLRDRHSYEGQLILAGPHVEFGSSAEEEGRLLDADPELARRVVRLGAVTEPERAWLLAHARAIIVPSIVEGFGLLPLEAASVGVPCLFAAQGSLAEVVSASLATLVPWQAAASADLAIGLLTDDAQRAVHLERLRAEAGRWAWSRLGTALAESYRLAVGGPSRLVDGHAWQELERERYLTELAKSNEQLSLAHTDLVGHIRGREGLARDDGVLTPHEQRGLLRVAARPRFARIALSPLALLGRVGRRAPERSATL